MYRAGHSPFLAVALALAAPAMAADSDTAPIAVQVTSSLSDERGFGRLMAGAASGDTEATARDLVGDLQGYRWMRVVDRDPEVKVIVERRGRTETSRSTDKKGRVTINHRYEASASLVVGNDRDRVDADTTYSQGPDSVRDDSTHFDAVSKELAANIAARVSQSLDALRPNRPQAGFDHKVKYKMLIRGDGLEVTAIEPGSPAEEAGLRIGDRIRSIDGEKGTSQMDAKVASWWTDLPGARYTMEVEKDKQKRIVQVSLLPPARWAGRSARPAAEPERLRGGPAQPPVRMTVPASAPASAPSSSGSSGVGVEIKPGMTQAQVVRSLGEPQKKVAFGAKNIWTYAGFTVTFVDGKVTDVK